MNGKSVEIIHIMNRFKVICNITDQFAWSFLSQMVLKSMFLGPIFIIKDCCCIKIFFWFLTFVLIDLTPLTWKFKRIYLKKTRNYSILYLFDLYIAFIAVIYITCNTLDIIYIINYIHYCILYINYIHNYIYYFIIYNRIFSI